MFLLFDTTAPLFTFFAVFGVFSATMVVKAENPVHSVLSLILTFLSCSAILLILEAEFLAIMFIVVYVGAIAVLFLFVVMMLDIKQKKNSSSFNWLSLFGIFLCSIIFSEIFMVIETNFKVIGEFSNIYISPSTTLIIDPLANLEALGQLLYTHYFIYFLLAGLILLVAMIGAIVLTMQLNRKVRRQVIFKQVARNFKNATFSVSLIDSSKNIS
jgi:NADH-quinone oxidoreductase subunit J